MVYCSRKDSFCYICGRFTTEKNKKKWNEKISNVYLVYYQMEWSNDKHYAPSVLCAACYTSMVRWTKKKQEKLEFKIPMFWFNPGDEHIEENCYFCVNKVTGAQAYRPKSHSYVSTDFTALPEPYGPNDSPPKFQGIPILTEEGDVEIPSLMSEEPSSLPYTEPSSKSFVLPKHAHVAGTVSLIDQKYLNTMCVRLDLSQRKSMELARMLRDKNVLAPEVTIYSQKHRQAKFIPLFTTENELSYCVNINELMEELHIQYDKEDWRLFIDSSKSGLKAVLLHNDNSYMPVAIAYSRTMKETYETMQVIFEKIRYNEHQWDVSGDFKVIALIMGLQLGRTKNACFICTWISTAKILHYQATWEHRTLYEIGAMNVVHTNLVQKEKILLPPLHIKLGLVTQFLKCLNTTQEAFQYLSILFPKLSAAKLKAGNSKFLLMYFETKLLLLLLLLLFFLLLCFTGIVNGPDIRKLTASDRFQTLLEPLQREAWVNIKLVITNFLGNYRAPNYADIVKNMLNSFERLNIRMSPKVHFMHQHLDFFKDNLGKISDEHGERFHQQVKNIENRFKGKEVANMLAEYIWTTYEEEQDPALVETHVALRNSRLRLMD